METASSCESSPAWQPLSATERRVVGVLVEKAKTTPENYPLTVNAIRVGSNQKSNRFPQMQLEEINVEDALDRLRAVGAVAEIVGDGRRNKYRHLLYKWLGVDKAEMAVMAELLLRGAQTIGELRGRAARMEPIADQAALRPILDALESRGLIVYLTPKGRGCVLTHNLYSEKELERLRREHEAGIPAPSATAATSPSSAPAPSALPTDSLAELRCELNECRGQVAELRAELEQATTELREKMDRLFQELGM